MKKRNLKRIRTIIWDCDNTIWLHRKDEVKIISKYFKITNIEELENQYFELLRQFDVFFRDKKVTFEKITKLIERYLPIIKEYEYNAENFLEEWLTIETSFLNEDALEAIKYLDSKGFTNVILTDWFWDSQIRQLKKYGILPYIKEIHTCDDTYLKSNPKSKSRVIKDGYEDEYLMVGDSLSSDIAFANMAKIQSVWFNPNFKENDTQYKPTYEINSMLELCKILV